MLLGRAAMIFVSVLMVITRIVSLLQGVDPWIDEAMLVRNLPVADGDITKAMPFYDQAGPLGYVWLASKIATYSSAYPLAALRGLSALASLGAAWCLYLAMRVLTLQRAAPLAIALGFLTFVPLTYAIEIKHYGIEVGATALLCAAGARIAVAPSLRSSASLLAAMIAAILFSFSAPVVIACVFVGVGTMRYRAALQHSAREVAIVGFPFVVAAIAFLLLYLIYTKPVTAYQFQAYRLLYGAGIADFNISSIEDVALISPGMCG